MFGTLTICSFIIAFVNNSPLPLDQSIPLPGPQTRKRKDQKPKQQQQYDASLYIDQTNGNNDPLSFIICPICTPDQPDSEPHMVLKSKWQDHLHGKVHKNAMYKKGIIQRKGPDQSEEAQRKRAARQNAHKKIATKVDEKEEEPK